ncbi:zonular occludens toxin domain-containing protein [Sedimentibacter sp.]|uniref:zonular occludens toxin domain-containing protein n=1 Tax=Sedimentibacter sp. TaxID=1960295 RepID=UPI0028B08973|nr:zonular occludens toxin domain-containing protein [Sedimentibacter sp.]
MIKCICGLPGSGKNQYATSLAIRYLKAGYKVYSSYPIKTYVRSLDPKRFFKKVQVRTFVMDKDRFLSGHFEPGSVLIFDEAWLDFFNMDWKSVDKDELKKYNGSRHLGINLYYVTQSPHRIIPYLRDVTDSFMWIERKLLFNKITEYYEIENVGKLVGEDIGQLSPRLVKQSIYFRKKHIMTSYDDSYLKDKVILDNSFDEAYEPFTVEYRGLIKRFRKAFKRKLDFYKNV